MNADRVGRLRWVLVLPGMVVAWHVALVTAMLARALAERLCPPDAMVSGACTAAWFGPVEAALVAGGAALAAVLIVRAAVWIAPSHHRSVAWGAYALGAFVAIALAVASAAWLPLACALTAGALAAAAIGGRPAGARGEATTLDDGLGFRARARSVGHALRGLATQLRTQPNARIHLLATVAVIAASAAIGLARDEWALLAVAIVLVWVAEALNTAFEQLADATAPRPDPRIGQAKDVAAAAVLVAALGAAAIGLLVFGPHLLRLLR